MGALRIGVKFCGNCNPHVDTIDHWPVDRPEWVERIAAALKG